MFECLKTKVVNPPRKDSVDDFGLGG